MRWHQQSMCASNVLVCSRRRPSHAFGRWCKFLSGICTMLHWPCLLIFAYLIMSQFAFFTVFNDSSQVCSCACADDVLAKVRTCACWCIGVAVLSIKRLCALGSVYGCDATGTLGLRGGPRCFPTVCGRGGVSADAGQARYMCMRTHACVRTRCMPASLQCMHARVRRHLHRLLPPVLLAQRISKTECSCSTRPTSRTTG
jgi:hypothetical protein